MASDPSCPTLVSEPSKTAGCDRAHHRRHDPNHRRPRCRLPVHDQPRPPARAPEVRRCGSTAPMSAPPSLRSRRFATPTAATAPSSPTCGRSRASPSGHARLRGVRGRRADHQPARRRAVRLVGRRVPPRRRPAVRAAGRRPHGLRAVLGRGRPDDVVAAHHGGGLRGRAAGGPARRGGGRPPVAGRRHRLLPRGRRPAAATRVDARAPLRPRVPRRRRRAARGCLARRGGAARPLGRPVARRRNAARRGRPARRGDRAARVLADPGRSPA